MKRKKRAKLSEFLRYSLKNYNLKLKNYLLDIDGNSYFLRNSLPKIEKYIKDFTDFNLEPRWIAIPGLRGVGKTTLIAQIFNRLQCEPNYKLFISLDEIKEILDVNLIEILEVYEEILGHSFEELKCKLYLFIDEVHYDPKWNNILKTLYDRSNKIFIICTGSSALSLQSNPDVSRRMVIEKLYPATFTEYQLLKYKKQVPKDLSAFIKNSMFRSKDAKEVYNNLLQVKTQVEQYWIGIDKFELNKYLNYGTLPYVFRYVNNDALMYRQIDQTLTNIIHKDIPLMSKFEQSTLFEIKKILYIIASQDVTSLQKIVRTELVNMKLITLNQVLSVLTKCEILLRIFPYGTHINQVKKPSKYLFLSSAYRSMFFNLIESTNDFDYYKGKLLEDIVGLYFYIMFENIINVSVTYDSSQKGADFIVKIDDKKIPIEVGYGEKDFKQIEKTLNSTNGIYGLSISKSLLTLSNDKKMVLVPVEYFLMSI